MIQIHSYCIVNGSKSDSFALNMQIPDMKALEIERKKLEKANGLIKTDLLGNKTILANIFFVYTNLD